MTDLNTLRQMLEGWRPPEGLDRGRPRPVEFTPGGMALALLAAALAAGALAGAVWCYRLAELDSQQEALFASAAVDGEAELTRLWRRGGDSPTYWVAYRFRSDDKVYSRSARVARREWEKLAAGARLPVRYVPEYPEFSRLGIERSSTVPYWLSPVLAIGLAAPALLIGLQLAGRRRLLAEGRAAPGIVTGLKGHTQSREVYYEFPTLSGGRGQGKYGPVSKKDAPAPGSALVVIYDPDNPKLNRRYPMPLVRLRPPKS